MKKLRTFTISFLLLKFSLILCHVTDPICFWRIKNNEENDGDLRSDCNFLLWTDYESTEFNFYNIVDFSFQVFGI
uniref:Vomeronasal 2, receptor 8 n=1 Tax=Mus musculus TaxID=10090 RepID=A0A3B2WCA1_MOUSE